MEELLKYRVVKFDNGAKVGALAEKEKHVMCLCVEAQPMLSRDDETILWKKIKKNIDPLTERLRQGQILFSLSLNQIQVNESQLFRLLGNWELHYPAFPLVITNVQNETYQKLLIVNGDFHKLNPLLDYWNANIATIIYSYITVKNGRFYFADILWGKERPDFINLNWIINHTNFNSTVLLNKDRMKNEVEKYQQTLNTNTEIAFYNNNTLLPFDLIFEGEGITTLFEHNALVLLKNEIKT
jgi:hypothetical protein